MPESMDADGEAARARVFERRVKQVTAERDRARAALDALVRLKAREYEPANYLVSIDQEWDDAWDRARAELSDPGVRVDGPDSGGEQA